MRSVTIAPFAASIAVGLATLLSGGTASANWADQAFPVKTHNFGTVAVSSKTEFRFPIRNPLNQPMHIRTVRASCGCTTPIVETPTIQPGGEGSLLARFNTPTFRGKKGATLTVVIDKPYYAEVRLRVDGYIRSDMVFHPGAIEFGSVDQGQFNEKTATVYYAGRSTWKILGVQANQPWIKGTAIETTRGGGRVNYSIQVTLDPSAPAGFFQDELVVTTNDRSMPRVPLRISGRIESALTISPQSIALGDLKPGQTMTKRLVVRGKQPFTIESIGCEGWDVSFEPTKEAKTLHIVNAQFTPIDAVGRQKVSVIVKTMGDSSQSAEALLTAVISD
ncbi:MAG: DUF1573 domain-containing protein [Planctomycetota bacterium]